MICFHASNIFILYAINIFTHWFVFLTKPTHFYLPMSHDPTEDISIDTEADIYVVESIQEKRVKDGKTLYKIKWLGYNDDECTWEEEENILDKEMINDFERKGLSKKNKKSTPKKEKLSKDVPIITKPIIDNDSIPINEIKAEDSMPSEKITTLNHLTKFAENIDKIECVFRENEGEAIFAYVVLKNRGRSVFPVSQLRELAPYKLIEYYESKLKFADANK